MAATPVANPRADVDPNLSAQLKSLQQQAAAEETARLQGNQVQWMVPVANDWTGDLFDFVGMAEPFDRSQSNSWFTEATKDANNPGTAGDLILTTTQIDYLACMERAFRSRHAMRRPRAMLLAMGRKLGHGNNKGPLVQGILEYVRAIAKQSKAGAQ